MIGETISHYQILERLGQGGMGEVYRAEDLNLGREVALKFLSKEFTGDADWLARFEREAKLLASLNHPNIGTIFGLESDNGLRFLALELVEGETLAEHCRQGAIPLREALKISSQIARAMESAHQNGVVHRDLKPANVKITPDGTVKVLDFGLAKSVIRPTSGSNLSDSPTIGHDLTGAGIILGTPSFMSPEQARGRPVDKRADIWAFGCILYQMLSGREGFSGDTFTDIIGAVVLKDPDWEALPPETPSEVRRLLRRCLQKEPDFRLHDISDFRIEIDDILSGRTVETEEPQHPLQTGRMTWLPWALSGVLAIVALVVLWTSWGNPESVSQPVRKLSVATERVAVAGPGSVALSRDGTSLAYVGNDPQQIYLRYLDQTEAVSIPGTENAWVPFFSPDGDWIGFWDRKEKEIKKVPVGRGVPQTIIQSENPYGAVWGGDNNIYYCAKVLGGGVGAEPVLLRVSANGGQAETVATGEDSDGQPGYLTWPDILPGGHHLLITRYASSADSLDEGRIEAVSLEDGSRKTILRGASVGRYAGTGHLITAWLGGLMAGEFDLDRLEVSGPRFPVLEGLRIERDFWPHFTLSAEGTLAYLPGSGGRQQNSLLWADRMGRTQEFIEERQFYLHSVPSPKGDQIALTVRRQGLDNIWIYGLEEEALTPVTFEGRNTSPVWDHEGDRLVFNSNRTGTYNLFIKPIDGSEAVRQLTRSDNFQIPYSISSTGLLAFAERDPKTKHDIWVLDLDEGGEPQPFLQTPANERQAMFSPDGGWIAYESDQSRRNEVYVRPYPGPGPAVQVSTRGGQYPVWHPNGKELFYLSKRRLMSVKISADAELRPSTPEPLFSEDIWNGCYAVSPDGNRFLIVQRAEEAAVQQVNLVLNWFEELERLAENR